MNSSRQRVIARVIELNLNRDIGGAHAIGAEIQGTSCNVWSNSRHRAARRDEAAHARISFGTEPRQRTLTVAQLIGISDPASKYAIAALSLQPANPEATVLAAARKRHVACIFGHRRSDTTHASALAPGGEQP